MASVVLAQRDDIEVIAGMERDIFTDFMSPQVLTSSLFEDLFLVLKDHDETCGYFLGHTVMDEMEIYRIAVLPSKRRCGYAKILLHEAMKRAESVGVKKCFLEVRESNIPARSLYGSSGFLEIDRRRKFYRMPNEDAIVMMRQWE